MVDHIQPDIPALLATLQAHDVAYVVVGSVAVYAWGVDVGTPADLDIVPRTSVANLRRLASVLREVDAESWPIIGRWRVEGGEFRWEDYPEDHPLFGTRIDAPDPSDIATFDSVFRTRHGDLDIVPLISGTYDDLIRRARSLTVHGVPDVPVVSIEDLLVCLTVPRRAKDAARVAGLRAVQRGEEEGQDVLNSHTRN
jgi:hypothetical protein